MKLEDVKTTVTDVDNNLSITDEQQTLDALLKGVQSALANGATDDIDTLSKAYQRIKSVQPLLGVSKV